MVFHSFSLRFRDGKQVKLALLFVMVNADRIGWGPISMNIVQPSSTAFLLAFKKLTFSLVCWTQYSAFISSVVIRSPFMPEMYSHLWLLNGFVVFATRLYFSSMGFICFEWNAWVAARTMHLIWFPVRNCENSRTTSSSPATTVCELELIAAKSSNFLISLPANFFISFLTSS